MFALRYLFLLGLLPIVLASGGCLLIVDAGLEKTGRITSSPPGADVYIANRHAGTTPLNLDIATGFDLLKSAPGGTISVAFKVAAPGHEPYLGPYPFESSGVAVVGAILDGLLIVPGFFDILMLIGDPTIGSQATDLHVDLAPLAVVSVAPPAPGAARREESIVRGEAQAFAPPAGARICFLPVQVETPRHTHDEGIALTRVLMSYVDFQRYSFIERERVADVIGELQFQTTTYIDREMALRIGRGLGAEYVVLGTLGGYGERLILSCWLVEVETQRQMNAATLEATNLDAMRDKFDDLVRILGLAP